MTVNELYRKFLAELGDIYETSEAANISSLVFENIAGITRAGIIKEPGRILEESISTQLNHCLIRLKMHEPVQYIIGEAWFYNMKLKVSPAVLIPRPETEELVEAVIDYSKDKTDLSILDIGTGCGCIAIAARKNLPGSLVTAIDLSLDALNIAKENSSSQKTDINFIQLDFLDEKNWPSLPMFNIIISNPPYIPADEKGSLNKNVTAFEPHLALFVENNRPLIFYEKIAGFAMTHLKDNGKIFMETHEHLAEETAALFNNAYYSAIIKKDMQEKQRMVMVTRHYR